ncbi:hypothetical protein GE061_013950 [Apolygus lucorum]|uniref:Uncharacterized protein n=1 Tax=Apolygus lucorum TaxID=248454 RepID=A0A8S9XQH0_APOLU|nr:hypothetical protein GE061_013950 [Apolygus lucorum]
MTRLVPSLLILVLSLVLGVSSDHNSQECYRDCSEVWKDKSINEHAQFQTLTNRSGSKVLHRFTWRWKSRTDHGMWDVFYTDLPTKGAKSGGFYYIKPIRQKSAFLNWKLYNKTLTWVSQNRNMHPENWNLTICGLGLPVYFRSNGDEWSYQIGNIKIGGGESGDTHIEDDMFISSRKTRHSKDLVRGKREAEDMEEDKKNVWKKLKGWFKELFDQGADDARGWMTRIADWVLGLLERILS